MIWLKAAVITLGIGFLILIGMVVAALFWPITIIGIIFLVVYGSLKHNDPVDKQDKGL